MSAFVGLRSLDGAPVDRALLARLTSALTYAGPDGSGAWLSRDIGLGIAHLDRTAGARRHGVSPAGVGALRLVADADLTDRGRLVDQLTASGQPVEPDTADAELILASFRVWGARCVEYLRGDFSFALWDGDRGRLLLARDRFGTRPLYYAHAGRLFVFSNSLDVLRIVPGVSDELDAGAVGDWLRIGYNTDPRTTIFLTVRCVPPAHVMNMSGDSGASTRYWDLPVDGRIRLPSVRAYAECFAELLEAAVSDRMRGADAVVILLSGGRDSTAVAALAGACADRTGMPALRAVTAVYDYAIPDEERRYAAMAAGALHIPVQFLPQDEYGWYERWDEAALWRPEPPESPELAADVDLEASAAAHARVALTGDGGDAGLRESESRLARLLLSGHVVRVIAEAARYLNVHRRIPRPGVRRLWARWRNQASPYPPVPPWLRPEFIARAALQERWKALESEDARQWARHPIRPEAFTKLRSVFWARCFEQDHATSTGQPLIHRHPFFDERLVEFLLGLPAAQWMNDKGIVVAAMRTRLPHRVVYRPKTPLPPEAFGLAFRRNGFRPSRQHFHARALEFIDPDALFETVPGVESFETWDWVRAYSFSRWLERLPAGRPLPTEGGDVVVEVASDVTDQSHRDASRAAPERR